MSAPKAQPQAAPVAERVPPAHPESEITAGEVGGGTAGAKKLVSQNPHFNTTCERVTSALPQEHRAPAASRRRTPRSVLPGSLRSQRVMGPPRRSSFSLLL